MIIKNRKLKDKNKDNIYLTNFSDEDDVSKYMKNYKNEIYNFNGNNSFIYNNKQINFNMINIFKKGFINKSFDKKISKLDIRKRMYLALMKIELKETLKNKKTKFLFL